ncbi:MAG: phosphoadenosine phosphosulfate reductase family protein [Acidaminococcales bacterium]|jgi:phosphoadenosine phosphosulfate reductase|nr:phosphoadenosine phosphosulfate reductase family protein [Acidaminococcales bacterium]
MLQEHTLWGLEDKEATAIKRLQAFCPEEGYYVAFSGGKDSIVVKDLVRRSGVKHDIHFSVTTVDPPELMRYVRQFHPDVERHAPQTSMRALIIKALVPPLKQARYCCGELKETGGAGRVTVTGIRWQESARRNKRQMVETCMKDSTKSFVHPIIDWSDREVWEYIRKHALPYCKLYDEGFKRIGCIMCPMAGPKGAKRDAERWPQYAEMYRQACIAAWERRVALGKENAKKGKKSNFFSGEEMYEWWTSKARKAKGEPMPTLFE